MNGHEDGGRNSKLQIIMITLASCEQLSAGVSSPSGLKRRSFHMGSVTRGLCLAVFGVALLCSTDALAMDQHDTQSPLLLAQAGGGSGGGSGGGTGGGMGGGTGGGMGSGGSGMGSGQSSSGGSGSAGSGMSGSSSGSSSMGSGGSETGMQKGSTGANSPGTSDPGTSSSGLEAGKTKPKSSGKQGSMSGQSTR